MKNTWYLPVHRKTFDKDKEMILLLAKSRTNQRKTTKLVSDGHDDQNFIYIIGVPKEG
jgi:hypothetical protein